MAAHKRQSLQNETGLRGTRRWATRVEEHEELLGLRRLDAPHGTGCEPELSSPLKQHQMSGLQIAPRVLHVFALVTPPDGRCEH